MIFPLKPPSNIDRLLEVEIVEHLVIHGWCCPNRHWQYTVQQNPRQRQFFFGDVTENSVQPTDGLAFPNPEEALGPHSRFLLNIKIYIDVIYKKVKPLAGEPTSSP